MKSGNHETNSFGEEQVKSAVRAWRRTQRQIDIVEPVMKRVARAGVSPGPRRGRSAASKWALVGAAALLAVALAADSAWRPDRGALPAWAPSVEQIAADQRDMILRLNMVSAYPDPGMAAWMASEIASVRGGVQSE